MITCTSNKRLLIGVASTLNVKDVLVSQCNFDQFFQKGKGQPFREAHRVLVGYDQGAYTLVLTNYFPNSWNYHMIIT
ncbi:hypothetical protein AN957_21000 [Cytobacillus solani]|uniref:Uncharacterized protein n=1 Tax=Cytobacillus solani TaxID=1637975 RepID=A0A0Q3TCB1_9BACI|nr:hypothetical protein AN957_21000 [Cytobacillus solani]